MSEDLGKDDGRYIGRRVRANSPRPGKTQQQIAAPDGGSPGANAKKEKGARPQH
ncbi:hypothetical protein [Nocardia abscessus]|uniref:hypothetical protein n=1 Tax=Nocardia abscessus TaxID=120957 RepID=UPI0024575A91|nr:hypothetical protein [Nocardia abscessus]